MKKNMYLLKWAVVIVVLSFLPTSIGSTIDENKCLIEEENYSIQNNLPHYLDGTILDGNARVIVTENGQPLDDMDLNTYDIIISLSELLQIEYEARNRYLDLYGVDVYEGIKPVTWKNITWPPFEDDDNCNIKNSLGSKLNIKEKISMMRKYLLFRLKTNENDYIVQSERSSPHQINGVLRIAIVFPIHDYKPAVTTVPIFCSLIGFSRFSNFESVENLQWFAAYNIWNADDVEFDFNLEEFLYDLSDDCSDIVDEPEEANILVLGWVSILNGRNGIARGHFSVCNFLATIEQPPFTLVQHELSHCFGAPDHTPHLPWPLCPWCVMNYFYLAFRWPLWCSGCYGTIENNIRG